MTIAQDLMHQEFIKLDANDTVSSFIGQIKKTGDTFGLIFEGKAYLGVADKKELLRSRLDATKTKVRHCLKHVPILTKSSKLPDMVRLMCAADVRALPVRDGNKILGIVTAKDLAKELQTFYEKIKIKDIIKKTVIMCNEDDSLAYALDLMVKKNIDRIPILKKDGKIAGIISIIDFLLKFALLPRQKVRQSFAASHSAWHTTGFQKDENQNLLRCPVSNQMTQLTWCCSKNDTVAHAINVMFENNLTSIIIVESQKPVGILTLKDVFEYYRKKT